MQLTGNATQDGTIVFELGRLSLNSNFKKILILEDDHFSQRLFDKIISENLEGITPLFAENCTDAQLALVRNEGIQLGILDIYLDEGKTGLDLYRHCLKKRNWQIPLIVTSAISEGELSELVGTDVPMPIFLKKPFRPDYCAALIKSILNQEIRT